MAGHIFPAQAKRLPFSQDRSCIVLNAVVSHALENYHNSLDTVSRYSLEYRQENLWQNPTTH
jgi:hypothetical protein